MILTRMRAVFVTGQKLALTRVSVRISGLRPIDNGYKPEGGTGSYTKAGHMIIYIVRRGSDCILGCYTSLARAKARADKEMEDIGATRPFDTIKQLSRGSQGKLYCLMGFRGGSLGQPWEHVRIWAQQHYLEISPLEALGEQAE